MWNINACGAFIFHILVKSEKKFQFLWSYTLVVAPMGVKFGMEEGTFGPKGPLLHGQISSPSVQRVARGAKNLKIGLWVN